MPGENRWKAHRETTEAYPEKIEVRTKTDQNKWKPKVRLAYKQ
jgi:hypothetical protein